jgi:hypothetical protein
MRFVKVEMVQDPWPANMLDPDDYLRELPALEQYLPAGAWAFATDADHYDFASARCVKDLKIDHMAMRDSHGELTLEIHFAPNKFKHTAGLVVQYSGVASFATDVTPPPKNERVWPESRRLGDLQLDEILPHERGCSHEIKMTGGSIFVICADLNATWHEEASFGTQLSE